MLRFESVHCRSIVEAHGERLWSASPAPALIEGAFQDVSLEELQRLEVVLKEIGKLAKGLAERKGYSQTG
jgi:hypothetical protein